MNGKRSVCLSLLALLASTKVRFKGDDDIL